MILESEGGRIAIKPDRFDKFITALRTAVNNDADLLHTITYLMLLDWHSSSIILKILVVIRLKQIITLVKSCTRISDRIVIVLLHLT